ncbi:hypothetical protein HBI37_143940 [Parastagonospora nodorum]|nr:hypothetical protein HBI37_143940 [Parastagonospora nodorum]KAH6350717.1 hypothetical protein HBI36_126260 [Parastagonospora nodorum]
MSAGLQNHEPSRRDSSDSMCTVTGQPAVARDDVHLEITWHSQMVRCTSHTTLKASWCRSSFSDSCGNPAKFSMAKARPIASPQPSLSGLSVCSLCSDPAKQIVAATDPRSRESGKPC